MTLSFDERCAGEQRQRELAEYVRDADPHTMETRAVEWKSTWEFSSAEVQFQVARQILGFGNRDPADAARAFGGYAYLLVGVQPGEAGGVTIPDPARLTGALRRFIAASRPSWDATSVRVDGVDVLIVEVAPPQDGDRICCLMRAHGNANAGTIYIRRPGQTTQADPTDVRALEDRLLAVVSADARRAVEAHERLAATTQEHVDMLNSRAAHDAELRARQRAPAFTASRADALFVFLEPHRMEGRLRNDGESEASVTLARLHRDPPGAVNGGTRAIYSSRETEPSIPVAIAHGVELGLVFDNAALSGLRDEPLTLDVHYIDDSQFEWISEIALHRDGTDVHGRHTWRVREITSRML
jgi:hypothetical protein